MLWFDKLTMRDAGAWHFIALLLLGIAKRMRKSKQNPQP
jgi:hypothetical protein